MALEAFKDRDYINKFARELANLPYSTRIMRFNKIESRLLVIEIEELADENVALRARLQEAEAVIRDMSIMASWIVENPDNPYKQQTAQDLQKAAAAWLAGQEVRP